MSAQAELRHRAAASHKLPVLDGLRGMAALLVVLSHASGLGLHVLPGLDLTGIGKYGVYLFFVLSAFLLTTQWLEGWRSGLVDGTFLRSYFVRRVLRIYPLYTLVLVVGLAMAPRGLGVPLDAAAVWRHLSLQEGRDIYWSIPVEFLYYLLIPPLSFLLAKSRSLVSAGIAWACLLVTVQWQWPASETPLNSSNLAYYLPVFLFGSFVSWVVMQRPPQPSALHGKALSFTDLSFVFLLALSVPALYMELGLATGVDALHRSFVGWGLAWSLLLLALLSGRTPLWKKLLDTVPMRACGRWCFSIYLLHMPCLYVAKRLPVPGLIKAWLAIGLVLLVASVAYRLVEKPAIRLGQRIV